MPLLRISWSHLDIFEVEDHHAIQVWVHPSLPSPQMDMWSSKWDRLTFVVCQARALGGQVLDLTVVLVPVRSEKPPHARLSVHGGLGSGSSAGSSWRGVMSLNMKGGGVSADAARCVPLSRAGEGRKGGSLLKLGPRHNRNTSDPEPGSVLVMRENWILLVDLCVKLWGERSTFLSEKSIKIKRKQMFLNFSSFSINTEFVGRLMAETFDLCFIQVKGLKSRFYLLLLKLCSEILQENQWSEPEHHSVSISAHMFEGLFWEVQRTIQPLLMWDQQPVTVHVSQVTVGRVSLHKHCYKAGIWKILKVSNN